MAQWGDSGVMPMGVKTPLSEKSTHWMSTEWAEPAAGLQEQNKLTFGIHPDHCPGAGHATCQGLRSACEETHLKSYDKAK